jgi:hypothetical protein
VISLREAFLFFKNCSLYNVLPLPQTLAYQHINTKYKLIMIFVLPRDLSKNHTSSPKGFDLMMDILLE